MAGRRPRRRGEGPARSCVPTPHSAGRTVPRLRAWPQLWRGSGRHVTRRNCALNRAPISKGSGGRNNARAMPSRKEKVLWARHFSGRAKKKAGRRGAAGVADWRRRLSVAQRTEDAKVLPRRSLLQTNATQWCGQARPSKSSRGTGDASERASAAPREP